jgi:hypothetical protein
MKSGGRESLGTERAFFMRSKFPWFWVLQFLLLSLVGLSSLFYPPAVLYFFRGYFPPPVVKRPDSALRSWVLGMEQIDPPNERVREFFAHHDKVRFEDREIWTPDDPSLDEFDVEQPDPAQITPEKINTAWEEVERWLLTCKPAPPPEHLTAITKWIRAMDQVPEPSADLAKWVVQLREPASPPRELRLMILEGTQALPHSWHLAAQQVRMTSPCIFAAAFFTLLGLLAPHIRRPLARIFVINLIFWCLAQLGNTFGPKGWDVSAGTQVFGFCLGVFIVGRMLRPIPNATAGMTAFGILALWWAALLFAAFTAKVSDAVHPGARIHLLFAFGAATIGGMVNSWYWLMGKDEDPPQDNGGIVQRRPPQLWTLWIVQFAILFCTGILAMLFPQQLAELFIREEFEHLTIEVVDDSIKTLGAWIICMALFSYFALGVGHDWVWQGISVVFCIVFLLLATSTVHVASTGEYSIWIYLYGFQGVAFIPLTLILVRQRDACANANVERMKSDEWSLTDLLVAPWLLCRPLRNGRRPQYATGIGARGHIEMLGAESGGDTTDWPPSDFFIPGRRLPVEMRFSNATQDDDASLDVRGCSLRIGGGATDRLDLLFATGEFSPFSTLIDFQRYLRYSALEKLAAKSRTLCEGLAAGLRRAPRSYADLSYYHQFVMEWATTDARCYLVRFRIVPESAPKSCDDEDVVETARRVRGIPSEDDLRTFWRQERRGDESRPVDYLRQELSERLTRGEAIHFRLEAQFHEPQPCDTLDWYNATIEWESRESPWSSIARIVLDEPMSAGDSDRQVFDPSRLPLSLTVPRPDRLTDVSDPRALASARFRIVRVAAHLRQWRNRIRHKVHR